jgi:DNA polymerase-3 subunit gamma/tau
MTNLFENMVRQPVTGRLKADIANNVLAPSMLFAGPPASGKGTAALEMGRAFSCETPSAPWNCRCHACSYHRALSHDDLVVTGPRPFSAEIAAARAALLRDTAASSSRTLFVRSVRKLLLRFSPVLLADDPKVAKLNGLLEAANDTMEELARAFDKADGGTADDAAKIAKLCDAAQKHTQKLEAEGIAEAIPVSHVRNAAYWLRIAPSGRRKLLVIENADRMQDAARNSLLKILEEPPETSAIILCSAKPEALLPTILSRLRHYGFARRDRDADAEVVRRVFKETSDAVPVHDGTESGITAYLDKFLPVPKNVLYPAAAFFWASMAAMRRGGSNAPAMTALGTHCAAIARNAGLGEGAPTIKALCAAVLSQSSAFAVRGTFTVFLGLLCSSLSDALSSTGSTASLCAAYRRTLLKYVDEARVAVDIYRQTPPLALERLALGLLNSFTAISA